MEYLIDAGGFKLRWYSTMVALGLVAGTLIAAVEARRRKEDDRHVYNAVLLALPLALIGARLYHVVHEWSFYSANPSEIVRIDKGGIGIYGAIAGSILAIWIYTRVQKLPFSRWLDIGAPGLLLGQAIGRWGNYFNQELYGKPMDLPWAIHIPLDKRETGYEAFSTYHPLFLYESLLNLLGVAVLMLVARRFAGKLKDGDIALMYGVWYGTVRLSLEGLRIGNWHLGDLPTATIISLAAIVGCGGALAYRHLRTPPARPTLSSTDERASAAEGSDKQ
ncbi:MAG: prolipoprotein diacylglyceryl transferase [Dehalococcoidia bacterium]|nr:prolipoprotein diacylglyceryl transferase [Dehalococcoidia bacterium]